MSKIRFSFLNRKYVTLYGSFSLGTGVEIGKSVKYNESINYNEINTQWHITGQLTLIGVKAGKAFFGFAEIGFGFKGFGLIGFGYHFNARNKNIFKY